MTTAFFIHAVHTVLGKYTGTAHLNFLVLKIKFLKLHNFPLPDFIWLEAAGILKAVETADWLSGV